MYYDKHTGKKETLYGINSHRLQFNSPGITMSPSPSIAKLDADSPFSRRSIGNITVVGSRKKLI